MLELKTDKDKIEYRWTTCVDEFNMPVKLTNGVWLRPTTDWTKLKVDGKDFTKATADNAFYVKTKTVK